uniref:Vitellogenic cathepsin-B like protease n=1 Tax=Aedes aegypti TaxID=7159 RepID=Q9Y1J6_AEDAE|nr:vitellogenic cathepsin-B like protease [Aedes aegypti]
MFRFVLVLACCQAALAQGYGTPSPKFSSKNSARYQDNQYNQYSGEYSGAQYPSRQYPANRNQSYFGARFQNTALLASKFSHLTRTWRAGSNPKPPAGYRSGVNMADLERTKLPLGIMADVEDLDLPDTFDAREKWPECPSLREIRDQGCCGSCWAVSAASAMTDRWCVRSKGKEQFIFGSLDLLSCCHSCGQGCRGGTLGPAWQFWVEKGLSSGGPLNSRQGCHPYPIGECRIPGEDEDTPKCSNKCRSGYNVTDVWQDRHIGRVAYSLPNDERKIMEEIFINGPVQAAFHTYLDLHAYKSGIYRHVWGPLSGGHAVKLLGWGVENGVKYWLVANSWGREWGENGFFKMVRGENHCGIEENIHAGLPNFHRQGEAAKYFAAGYGYN